MAILGKKREGFNDKLDVGFLELEVLKFCPTKEEIIELLGVTEENEDKFKEQEYANTKDGVKTVRIDIWLKGVKNDKIYKRAFFLENKERVNKLGTTYQFINEKGQLTWADAEENLPSWFVATEVRKALVGEEGLYNFLRVYLTELDFKDDDTKLALDTKALFLGQFDELNDLIGSGYEGLVVGLGIVKTVEKEGEVKQYQNLYEKFLPAYLMKQIRISNYTPESIEVLRAKNGQPNTEGKKIYLKGVDAFVVELTDPEYGCKDEYVLKPLQEYKPEESFVAGKEVIQHDNTDASY